MTFTKNIYKLYKDKSIRNILLCAIIVMVIISVLKEYMTFNFTESEPIGIYLLSKTQQYNINDMVTISSNINSVIKLANEREYTTAPRLLKTILGVPGDTISIKNHILIINEKIIGMIYSHDSQNRPLPSIIKEGVIPPDQYFLASRRRENSFDSRYFGLISKECIQKKATPFWIN